MILEIAESYVMRSELKTLLDSKRLAQKAAEVIGVEAAEGWLQFPAYRQRPDGSEGDVIMLFAIEPDSRLRPSPPVVVGQSLRAGDESVIVLNSIVRRKEPDVQLGDEIVFKVGGRKRPFIVIGFCYGVMFPMAYAPYDAVSYISNDRGLATTALIKLVPPDEDLTDLPGYINTTTGLLEKHFKRSGIPVSSIQTILEERAEAESSFNIIISLLLLMAGLLALVGGLGLMGTMSINVLERTREIGILRAIGAHNRGVSAVFIREGVAIGLLSWLLALPFAFPLGRFLSHIVGVPLTGSSLIYSYSYTGVWIWLILVVFLSALASFVPARNASRLTVREVLSYE